MYKILIIPICLFLISCGGDNITTPEVKINVPEASIEVSNWRFLAEGFVRSTALIYEDFVYFGDNEGNLYALDKITGEKQWQRSLEGEIDTTIVQHNEALLVNTSKGGLYAINLVTGEEIWHVQTKALYRLEYDYFSASPLVHEETVYIPTENGVLLGVDVNTGNTVWEYPLLEPAHSQPIISNDNICVSSMTALSCISLGSKSLLWRVAIDWPSSPEINSDSIVVGSRWDYSVYSLDINTGEIEWQYTAVDWVPGKPTIYENVVYLGSSDNHAFLALNSENGDVLWRADTVANVFSRAVVNTDYVVFSSGYAYNVPGFGEVTVLDHSGEKIQTSSGTNFFSSPVVENNHIYIGSDDGFFYSIAIAK